MRNDKNLRSVISQIKKINWGHLQIEKGGLIEIDNKLVQIMNTDVEGHLYFIATINAQKLNCLDKKYYADLCFEDKTNPQKIQVTGYVCAEENQLDNLSGSDNNNFLLFKFKIMKVEITKYVSQNRNQSSIINLLNSLWK